MLKHVSNAYDAEAERKIDSLISLIEPLMIIFMGGISIWQLLIILAIVVLLFGTKKLKNIGSDLGGAVKGFKDSLDGEDKAKNIEQQESAEGEKTEADTQQKNESR